MNKREEKSIIIEIQNEYENINKKWLKLHYHTFIGLVIFAFVFESITAVVFYS